MIAIVFLIAISAYLACGLSFAVPFILVGVKRIDQRALHGSWGFRLLIIPGTVALWPVLLKRWISGVHESPEECTAHRKAARRSSPVTDTPS
jgi:hypothetical protein